jgi:hypothetical protein
MAEYTVVSGDTFASVAKKFYNDEAASKALASFNKVKDDTQPPSQGTTLSLPSRLYSVKSKETSDNTTTVALSLYLQKKTNSVIFYSPASKKYCLLDAGSDSLLSSFKDECKATQDMAQKILDAWKEQDFKALISNMQQVSRDVETFFTGLSGNPKNALDELLCVTKHPKWDAAAKRLFIRPGKLTGSGEWKDAADSAVRDTLNAFKKTSGDYGLDTEVLSALCNSAHATDTWPWQWNFSDAASAASDQAKQFSSAVTAQFVRFIAGCGLKEKLDALEKKLSLGKSGSLSFSLARGTMSGTWYLPSETGINLFDIFQVPQGKNLCCLLRCQVDAKGYACAESELSHFVSLPGLSLGTPGPGPQAGLGGAGSAQAQGTLKGAIGWSPQEQKPFASLATVDLAAQLDAKEKAAVSFSDNKVRCSIPLKDIKGFSGKGSIVFDVNAEEGMRLVEHVFGCIVKQYLSGLTGQKDGFASLVSSRFQHVIDFIEKKTATVVRAAKAFADWFNNGSAVDGTANATWYVPEKQGFDLVSMIQAVPLLKPLLKPGVHCYVRMRIEMTGYAFGRAGGTSLPSGIPSSVNLAAAGSGNLSACVEWRGSSSEEFRILGSVQSAAAMSAVAGMSMPVPAAFEYKNGTLNGLLSLKAIPGLGISQDGSVAFTASGDEAKAFVDHLFSSLNVSLDSFMKSDSLKGVADAASSAYGAAKGLDKNIDEDAKKAAKKLFG